MRGWGGVGTLTMAALVAGAIPATAGAQQLVVSGGVSSYDLSGTGSSAVAAVRYEAELTTRVAFEVGSAVFRYESQSDRDITYLMPEAGVRLRTPIRTASLALAVGGGLATTVEGPDETEGTLFAALGLDIPFGDGWGIRPEARFRVIDPWVGTMMDVTLGLTRRFGR